jgi:sulfite exporter TauE/SafE
MDSTVLTLLMTVFVASLLGSLHCAGMCGPFIAFCVGTERQDARRHAMVQTAYHGGRMVSYALLGAIAGALGAAANWGGDVIGIQRTAMIVGGVFMVGFGLVTLLRILGVRIGKAGAPKALQIAFMKGQAFAQHRHPVVRAGVIGLLSIFLPCGWLYFFVIASATTGSAWAGALAMIAFWLGTVPVLAAVGVGVQTLFGPLRRHLPAAMSCLLLIVGVVVIVSGTKVDAHAALPTVQSDELSLQAAVDRVHGDDGSTGAAEFVPPCCAGEKD